MTTEEIEVGDLIVADESAFYREVSDWAYEEDGKFYAELVSATPDGDNDLKCRLTDENGNLCDDTNYVDAESYDVVQHHPNVVDEELKERVGDDPSEETKLDVLDEEKENLIQMQAIKSRTVAPDILELDVNKVVSAENSQQWAIIVDHPSLGELRFYEEKPITGWSDEYRIVRLLKSYGIHDGNPYKLQTKQVYVEFTGTDATMESHWELLTRNDVVNEYGQISGTNSESRERDSSIISSIPILNRFL
jgi:hypothetical protein